MRLPLVKLWQDSEKQTILRRLHHSASKTWTRWYEGQSGTCKKGVCNELQTEKERERAAETWPWIQSLHSDDWALLWPASVLTLFCLHPVSHWQVCSSRPMKTPRWTHSTFRWVRAAVVHWYNRSSCGHAYILFIRRPAGAGAHLVGQRLCSVCDMLQNEIKRNQTLRCGQMTWKRPLSAPLSEIPSAVPPGTFSDVTGKTGPSSKHGSRINYDLRHICCFPLDSQLQSHGARRAQQLSVLTRSISLLLVCSL